MKNIPLIFAIALFSGALAACGGGGGSAGAGPIEVAPEPERVPAGEGFASSEVRMGVPRDGSVIQSSNTDERGITQDAIEVGIDVIDPDFSGSSRMVIAHTGADVTGWTVTVRANNLRDFLEYGGVHTAFAGPTPSELGLEPYDLNFGAVFTESYLAVTSQLSDVSLTNDDVRRDIEAGDWLAFGYWAYAPNLAAGRFEVGTFADGGKLVSQAIQFSGEAEYMGSVDGYAIGGAEAEYLHFYGGISLRADFDSAAPHIMGKIENLYTDRSGGYIYYLDSRRADIPIAGWEMTLDRANINGTGFFTGALRTTGAPSGEDYTFLDGIEGHWGGQFSHDDHGAASEPDFAIGTFGGKNDGGVNVIGGFLVCGETLRRALSSNCGYSGE